jgi:gas vesicle protein
MVNHENQLGQTQEKIVIEHRSSSKGFILGALIGGVVGAATAAFLIPKSGNELRQIINEQATNLMDKGDQLISKGSNMIFPKTNDSVNKETVFHEKEEGTQRPYIKIIPSITSDEDLHKKLLETQRAFEEVEEKIK